MERSTGNPRDSCPPQQDNAYDYDFLDKDTFKISDLLRVIPIKDVLPLFDEFYGVSDEERAQRQLDARRMRDSRSDDGFKSEPQTSTEPNMRSTSQSEDDLSSDLSSQANMSENISSEWYSSSTVSSFSREGGPASEKHAMRRLLSNWDAIFSCSPSQRTVSISAESDIQETQSLPELSGIPPSESQETQDSEDKKNLRQHKVHLEQPSTSSVSSKGASHEKRAERLADFPPMPLCKKISRLLRRINLPPTRKIVHLTIPKIPFLLPKFSSSSKAHRVEKDQQVGPLGHGWKSRTSRYSMRSTCLTKIAKTAQKPTPAGKRSTSTSIPPLNVSSRRSSRIQKLYPVRPPFPTTVPTCRRRRHNQKKITVTRKYDLRSRGGGIKRRC